MKILMTGEFWRGCLGDSYFRAFKQLGCDVVSFDEAEEYKNMSRLSSVFLVNKLLQAQFVKLMNKKLVGLSCDFKPDLCIIMKGQRILPDTISMIRERTKAICFNINADDPLNKNRGASSGYVRKSLCLFDCYFVWSKKLISKLAGIGVKKLEYLAFGFDPAINYPVEVSQAETKRLGHDLVFVGAWDYEREKWLKVLVDFDLGLWGHDYWKTRCKDRNLRRKWQKKAAYGEDMSRVLNSSKITLNVLRQQNKGSHNMRTFEGAACGVFVLSERSPETSGFFVEDKEAVYFSSPEELRDKARYYLEHNEQRNKVAECGYQRCIKSNYAYLDRAKQVLEVFKRQ